MIDPASPDYRNTPASDCRPGFKYAPRERSAAPYVTIVTPFFNTGAVFAETAKSVLRQSFQAWEWKIINDGSTDPESLKLLEQYRHSDPRIQVIDHETNRGLSASRNTGFRAATTPFVAQVDSDDLMESTAVEKWFWFLESYPEFSFVKGYTVGFGEQEYLWSRGFEEGKTFLEQNQVDATAMIRRDIHEKVGGYDETNRQGLEDWDFWLKCADRGYWGATIPEFLDWYRRRTNHADRWKNLDYAKEYCTFQNAIRKRYPKLWKNGFPNVARAWHLPNQTVPSHLPAANLLQKSAPRLLLLLPWLTTGGADKFNLDVVEQLSRRGWEVTIATTLQGDHSWLPAFSRWTPDVFVLNHFLRLPDYPRFLRYLIQSRSCDAVMVSNSELGYLLLPYLRFHSPDTTFLDYCHMEEEHWKNGGYPRMAVGYQEMLDLNCVSSNHLKQWMVRRGASAERIEVCHTNVDTARWTAHSDHRVSLRRELGIPADMPLLLYAARICEQKQPKVFAETVAGLKDRGLDFIALVAGNGPDFGWLKSFVQSRGLDGKVLLLGAVPNERVRQLMAASDIFFLPSQWEGVSVAIYEAMACGLAVVSADVGGQSELVTPDCGVLIKRGSEEKEVEEYTTALSLLVTDSSLRRRMAQNGRARVQSQFTIDRLRDRVIELLDRARDLHSVSPRPLPGPGLAQACAAEAIEYTRLFQLADQLWREKHQPQQTTEPWTKRNQPNLRTRIFLTLERIHEPYYRWYAARGWTFLDPVRKAIRSFLLR